MTDNENFNRKRTGGLFENSLSFSSKNRLPDFKVEGAWRFRKSEIDRWISEREKVSEDQNG